MLPLPLHANPILINPIHRAKRYRQIQNHRNDEVSFIRLFLCLMAKNLLAEDRTYPAANQSEKE